MKVKWSPFGSIGMKSIILNKMEDRYKTSLCSEQSVEDLWRFAKEEDAMSKNVKAAKYGINDLGWWTKESSYSHGVSCLKSMSAYRFKSLVHSKVNDGSRFYFAIMSSAGIDL